MYASFLLSQISAYIAILCMLYKHETRRSLMIFKANLSCFFSMLRYRISRLATGLLAEFQENFGIVIHADYWKTIFKFLF